MKEVLFREESRFAKDEDILLFHSADHLKRFDDKCREIRSSSKRDGRLELAVDVNVEWGSNKAVRGAAGCVLQAIDDVFEDQQTRWACFYFLKPIYYNLVGYHF